MGVETSRTVGWEGEMTHSAQPDLSSDPSHTHKKPGLVMWTCNPSPEEAETSRRIPVACCHWVSEIDKLKAQGEILSQRVKVESNWRLYQTVPFGLHVHLYTQEHIHINMYVQIHIHKSPPNMWDCCSNWMPPSCEVNVQFLAHSKGSIESSCYSVHCKIFDSRISSLC